MVNTPNGLHGQVVQSLAVTVSKPDTDTAPTQNRCMEDVTVPSKEIQNPSDPVKTYNVQVSHILTINNAKVLASFIIVYVL